MGLSDLTQWFDRYSGPECFWFAKRLSGNETLANGSDQPGPCIPKEFLLHAFPSLKESGTRDLEIWFELSIDSHGADSKRVRGVFYDDKHRDGTRGGFRISNLGGSRSALLDPENTGALTVFVFLLDDTQTVTNVRVWVCRDEAEEELVEYRIGPVEPGYWVIQSEKSGLKTILPPFAPYL